MSRSSGRGLKNLQPGSLYVTIAIPPWATTTDCLRYLPHDIDLDSYETVCAQGHGREEFDWGLYWHRSLGDGVWYRLRRDEPACTTGGGPTQVLLSHAMERKEMTASPRLQHGVVGMMRVVRVGAGHDSDYILAELTSYLDWLTEHTAPFSTRSFVWATSCFLRTQRHVATRHTALDCSGRQHQQLPLPLQKQQQQAVDDASFTATAFLAEALTFAYAQVWSAFAGQLPRPLLASAFGVELVDPDGEDEGELGRRAARALAQHGMRRCKM